MGEPPPPPPQGDGVPPLIEHAISHLQPLYGGSVVTVYSTVWHALAQLFASPIVKLPQFGPVQVALHSNGDRHLQHARFELQSDQPNCVQS